MKRLEQLPDIVDATLDGLKADEAMKQRILRSARDREARPVRRGLSPVRVAACACACVLAVGAGLWIGLRPQKTVQEAAPSVYSMTAGETSDPEDAGQESAASLEAKGAISVGSKSASSGKSLWATGKNAFPMIGIEGRYYRLLTEPTGISSSLLGKTVGTVAEYTIEPALASQDIIMSNIVPSGTAVRAVGSMGSALVAAEVDGVLRVFQRVSFNGSALRGSEKLADTLQAAGHITSMSLSGVGTVEGKSACDALYSALVSGAAYESSGSLSSGSTLQIALDNGITLQLMVKGDRVAACGVWSCPGFTEAFEAAVQ